MKLFIYIIIINSFFILPAQDKKVLFLGLDGCRSDALELANTPNIDALIENGLYFNDALCSLNGQPTVSGPGWSSMITGVWFDKHGVADNTFNGSDFSEYSQFNVLLEESGQEFHSASFIMWSPIHTEIFGVTMDYNELHPGYDGSVAQAAAEYMDTEELDILFLDFDHIDHAGHTYGFSPEIAPYIDTIEEVDEYIGWVITAMETRPNFTEEEWLIILTSDHGGIGYSHGGQTLEERQIPIILSGPSIVEPDINEQANIVDLVPTIIQYLDEEIDCSWQLDGTPIGLDSEIFPQTDQCPKCPYPLVAERNHTDYSINLSWTENTISGYSYSLFRNQELIAQLDSLTFEYTDYPNLIGIENELILDYTIILVSEEESICSADVTTGLSTGLILLNEKFDGLDLLPAVDEALFEDGGCTNTIPQDILGWTHAPPDDWTINNSLMPESGTLEWRGWSFASKEFWVMAEDQQRSQFNLADGNVAVTDPDEWDDCGNGALAGPYNSILASPVINISRENTLQLTFDSHFRTESPQQIFLTIVDSSGNINILLHYSDDIGSDNMGMDMLNEHLSFTYTPENDDEIYFNWIMSDAGNNWYWAIDNVFLQVQTPAIGDLNDDQLINILDIIFIVNIILGDIYPDEVINHISDLNYDGLTNIMDVILLVNYILNI